METNQQYSMIFGCVAKWGYPHMREHDDKLINHWIQGYLATFSGCRDMVAMNTVVMMRTAQRLEMSYVLVVPNRLRQYGSRRMYCFGTAVRFETTIELCHSHQVKPLGNSFQISFTVILSNKVFQSIWNLIVFLFVINIYIYDTHIHTHIYTHYVPYFSIIFHRYFPSFVDRTMAMAAMVAMATTAATADTPQAMAMARHMARHMVKDMAMEVGPGGGWVAGDWWKSHHFHQKTMGNHNRWSLS